jgi:hypothetical protein
MGATTRKFTLKFRIEVALQRTQSPRNADKGRKGSLRHAERGFFRSIVLVTDLVEVRGFEPLTPCMPCRLFQFAGVYSCPHAW